MPDEVVTSATGSSIDINTDAPIQSATPAANQQWLSSVPEAHRSKPWVESLMKHENPAMELFNQFDNAQSLIGRKAEGLKIPTDASSPEEWKSFHKAIGVPENVEGYEYKAPVVPESLKEHFVTDDNLLNEMRKVALEAGMTQKAFSKITEAFDNYYIKELEKAKASADATMSTLENNFKSKYGDRAPKVLEAWQNSIVSASKEHAAVIEALPPAVKVALAEQYETFAKKYIREDNLGLDIPSTTSQMGEREYAEEYAKTFAQVRGTKPGSAEHEAANQKLRALREKGAQIFKK